MAKAKQRKSSPKRAKPARPAGKSRPAAARKKVASRAQPKRTPGKARPAPKSAEMAKRSKSPTKAVGGKPLPAKSIRERAPVKEAGNLSKASGAAKIVAAKLAAAKERAAAAAAKPSKDGKQAGAKAGAAKAAAGKAADAKGKGAKGKAPPVPPPPPRKIQIVQLSTLKPGARGSKSTMARRIDGVDDKSAAGGAKKRRSAELTSPQLQHFRELLEQRRHRLSSDLTLMQDEALKVTGQDNSADSVADAGTDNYEQDFTLGLIESEEALAREVDEALVRIDKGLFGVCESCETPIPLARLEILPFTRCCVECQQKREGAI
jgi:DnaK suppressor protein